MILSNQEESTLGDKASTDETGCVGLLLLQSPIWDAL